MHGRYIVVDPLSQGNYALAWVSEVNLASVIGGSYEILTFCRIPDFVRESHLEMCGVDLPLRLIYEEDGVEILEVVQLGNFEGKYILIARCASRVVQLVLGGLYGHFATIYGYNMAGGLLFRVTLDIYRRLVDVSEYCHKVLKLGSIEDLFFSLSPGGFVSDDWTGQYIYKMFGITCRRISSKG